MGVTRRFITDHSLTKPSTGECDCRFVRQYGLPIYYCSAVRSCEVEDLGFKIRINSIFPMQLLPGTPVTISSIQLFVHHGNLYHIYNSSLPAAFNTNLLRMLILLVNSSSFSGAKPPFLMIPSNLANSLAT